MTGSTKSLVTDLVGWVVMKRKGDEPGREFWPSVETNAAGEYIGTIRAVWISQSGELMISVKTPSGTLFQTGATSVLYIRKGEV